MPISADPFFLLEITRIPSAWGECSFVGKWIKAFWLCPAECRGNVDRFPVDLYDHTFTFAFHPTLHRSQ
jgi:hypothetical protein